MPTVILDPGHGGMDPGAVYQGRQEKDDNLRRALAVCELLAVQGVDVLYTRTDDVYDSPYRKAMIANESGADYLISFHRNASPNAGSASGIETLVYADRGVAAQMARDINRELAALGFRDIGVIERPGLAILRRSRMPAVLIETGFIDNEADNLKFDDEFEEIAEAIANGILETLRNEGQLPEQTVTPVSQATTDSDDSNASADRSYDASDASFDRSYDTNSSDSIDFSSMNQYTPEDRQMKSIAEQKRPPLSENTRPPKLYRVQVGAFRNRNYAYELNEQLTEEGFPAFILMDGDWYKVQVGAFSRLENAIRMEYRLRAAGYDTYITT